MVKSKHSAPDRVMKLDLYPERDKITWIHYLTPCGYIHEVCHKVQFVPSLCDQALFGVLSLTDCVNFSLLLCCQNLGGLVLLLERFLHFQLGPQPLESLQVASYLHPHHWPDSLESLHLLDGKLSLHFLWLQFRPKISNKNYMMWWLHWRCGGYIGSSPDFWGRGPRFESGFSHSDPGALQDHCVVL